MKQLTIYCSSDLSDRVRDALVHAGVEGFVTIPHAVGSRPGATWEHGRYPRWDAEVFLAPAPDEQAQRVVDALRDHCGKCDVEPCMKIFVAQVEAIC